MASLSVLLRRVVYGGRKGRSAMRRLRAGVTYRHRRTGASLVFRLRDLPSSPSSGDTKGEP